MRLKTRITPGKFADNGGGKTYRPRTTRPLAKIGCLAGWSMFAGTTSAFAQENSPTLAQVVALDECDPTTFNAALGADFCKNVTLGAFTTFDNLFAEAAAGTPDPNWDFEA